jgi:Phosphotransferase enzyme family
MQSDTERQPDTAILRAVGLNAATIRSVERMPGGLSGASLWRVTTRKGSSSSPATSYVLKRVTPESGWLGSVSQDTLMREVTLWESGLLNDLPNEIDTSVLQAVRGQDEAGAAWGALLMRDESPRLMRHPLRAPLGYLPGELRRLLDILAMLHVRYWEDLRLDKDRLGLTPTRAALLLISPVSVETRIASGDSTQYLALARSGWDEFFRLAPSAAAKTLRAVFAEPQCYIAAIQSLPKTLVHGDIWGPNLGWLPGTITAPRQGRRLLLLDWALATAGPATYDPLWLCGTWHALDPVRVLAYYRARLDVYLAAHGRVLDSAAWLALADAGYLRTALTCGEALARTATTAPLGAARRRAEAHVRWWATRAALAAERLAASG